MKKLVLALAVLTLSATAAIAAPKSYQVTGPVLAVDGNTVTVQKGAEKWEILNPTGTTVKVGDKVTIKYTMSATAVEVKADKKAAPAKGKK